MIKYLNPVYTTKYIVRLASIQNILCTTLNYKSNNINLNFVEESEILYGFFFVGTCSGKI